MEKDAAAKKKKEDKDLPTNEEIDQLKVALALASIPLEALLATECDDEATALSEEMKDGICAAVVAIRLRLDPSDD